MDYFETTAQKAQYYFYNLFTAADKNLRVNKSILTLLLAAIIGSWHSARAQTEVIIGDDKSSTGFETKTCGWIYKQYLINETRNLQLFMKSGGQLDCSRKAVEARAKIEKDKLAPIQDLSASAITARWNYSTTTMASLVEACYLKLEEHQRKQARLFDDLVNALRVRIALYDVNYLLKDPNGKKLLLNQCQVFAATGDNRASGKTFTGRRLRNQTDAEFIRDHSIVCSTMNQVEVRASDFQNKLNKNYVGLADSKSFEANQGQKYSNTDQIRALYANDAVFEDRQTCQQVINNQDALNEANRIKPPVERAKESTEKREKPDQCKQFERTFDCGRLEENKEIRIIVGWPMCAKEIVYDCVLSRGLNARPPPDGTVPSGR